MNNENDKSADILGFIAFVRSKQNVASPKLLEFKESNAEIWSYGEFENNDAEVKCKENES